MGAPVREGEVLGGKYKVERVIGEGGMGVVVAATHLQLQERVALKFLLMEVSTGTESAARFMREAQAAVKIKSEHVARVTDVGTLETGAPFMVMEYLEGKDLSELLAASGPVSIDDATAYVLQACSALAEAHRAGIIHRDLKPANLFLTRRTNGSACVKVLDFGISKIVGDPQAMMQLVTRTSAIMGSPSYMSPEQLRASRDVDFRTDIWSLGIIFYELLTGESPFLANTLPELCAAILTNPAPSVRVKRPDVPVELDHIILKCLQKNPDERYLSIPALVADLEPFLPDKPRTARSSSSPTIQVPKSDTHHDAKTIVGVPMATQLREHEAEDEIVAAPKRSRVPLIVGALAVLAAFVGLVLLTRTWQTPSAKPKASAPATAVTARNSEPVISSPTVEAATPAPIPIQSSAAALPSASTLPSAALPSAQPTVSASAALSSAPREKPRVQPPPVAVPSMPPVVVTPPVGGPDFGGRK